MAPSTGAPVWEEGVGVRILKKSVGKGHSARSSADDQAIGNDVCRGRTLAGCRDVASDFDRAEKGQAPGSDNPSPVLGVRPVASGIRHQRISHQSQSSRDVG